MKENFIVIQDSMVEINRKKSTIGEARQFAKALAAKQPGTEFLVYKLVKVAIAEPPTASDADPSV